METVFTNLKEGSLVEIETTNMQNKTISLKTIVEEVISASEIKLFSPIHKGLIYTFSVGESFKLIIINKSKIHDRYEIYSCVCKVVKRKKEGALSTITVVKTSDFEKIQRRNYFRLPLVTDMTVVFDHIEYTLTSRDLSGNGIRGYLTNKIAIGAVGQLKFRTENNGPIDVDIEVIACSKETNGGLKFDFRATFINLKNSDLSVIMKYIFFKQSETIKNQFDHHQYQSILDTDKSYSDFFSMTNVEKIMRLIPIALWAMILVEYAYLTMAFRDLNMGLNFFFRQIKPTFKPGFLITANSIAFFIIVIATVMLTIGIFYNKKKHLKTSISLILQVILSIVTIIIYNIKL